MNKYTKQAQAEWVNPTKLPTKGDFWYMAVTVPAFMALIVWMAY